MDGVDLSIASGEVLALLGPNGAGKITLIRMIATLLDPSSGSIRVDGFDSRRNEREVRARTGLVLGGDRGFYLRATVEENLRYFASLSRVDRGRRADTITEVLDAVHLQDRRRDPVETLSRGLKQRLHIARGLLSNPALLLLDEPTIGLDPEAALALRGLIRELKARGCTVLLTTHYLFEAESLADDVAVIIDGRIVARGSVPRIAEIGGVGKVTALITTHLPPELARTGPRISGSPGHRARGRHREGRSGCRGGASVRGGDDYGCCRLFALCTLSVGPLCRHTPCDRLRARLGRAGSSALQCRGCSRVDRAAVVHCGCTPSVDRCGRSPPRRVEPSGNPR
ncbi:ABC transporter ATP-binding protein [Rathayibacter tanaceti]|uniref:ATP-binding cassette domain-containing protein n=2 Tax=Rathayibacter tanaceti TaxID=1671680 RepID=A0A166IHB3_9MICO|nr:Daunorubicin/doxorubicin resistance ATP-binding protein DrrA [Rathayibacter tanaceti]QHC55451.1 ATP-binding cassette domain-containing protein [Rathayibacter tanaceti]TCO39777.1 ABC-type multidrug transport system ATPase subunit [Rathayibacter tanaceti]